MFLAFFKKKEKKVTAHLRYSMSRVMAEMKRNKCKTISCNFDQISFEQNVWVVNVRQICTLFVKGCEGRIAFAWFCCS